VARPKLSAALIVRDESQFLADCLSSIQPVVDEIVVVDTGSVDDTPDIALAHGAAVHHHAWRGDFGEARNVALDTAHGEWILYIDADERLEPVPRDDVEALLGRPEAVAYRLLLRPSPRATPYREYRLWRHDPRIRFDGVIHEKVVPAIHAVADADGSEVLDCDLELVHHGYEGDQTRKHHRNLPLLRRQREIEPENLFVWHHLARVLAALGDPSEEERTLRGGLEVARSKDWQDPLSVLLYADLVWLRMMAGEDPTALIQEGLELFPDNLVLLWMHVRLLIQRGQYEPALEQLDRMGAVEVATLPDKGTSYDEALVRDLPHEARGLCMFRLGRYGEAAEEYAAALSYAPDNAEYRAKLALSTGRARRSVHS
jgi:glycosyltransferase involved in cell wall biosynthesis